MLAPEEKLKRAAMSFGAWQERASKTKTMADRIKFIHAETALGVAAQKFYDEIEKELRREERRRNKG